MGMVGYTGNGFAYASNALIFYIKPELSKRDFKKDMMEGWSATKTANYSCCITGLFPLEIKEENKN